jgi:hypothetical protein
MLRFGGPVLSVLGLLCAFDAAAAGSVLIAPFPPGTVRPGDAAALDDELRKQAAALPGVDLQPRAETKRHLQAMEGLGMSCHPDETRCLVELGTLAGVSRVISTQAVAEGTSMRVTLRLIDIAGNNELRRIAGRVERETLPTDVEGLATGLLLPSIYKGRLFVEADAGASVLVDGRKIGETPFSEPIEVGAGSRTVRVDKPGFGPTEQVVIIPYKGTAEVEFSLRPASGGEGATTHFERTRVLVLDLLATGEGLPNTRTLSSVVAVELARDPGLDVLSGTDVDQLIAASEAGLEIDCQDSSCLTDLAGALDVPLIVHGDVGLLGSVLVVHLDVFDAERVETVARTSVENTDRDALSDEVKDAARDLLRDARTARPELVAGPGAPPAEGGDAADGSSLATLAVVGWGAAAAGAAVGVVGGAIAGYFLFRRVDYDTKLADYQRESGDGSEALGDEVVAAYDAYGPVGEIALPVGTAAAVVGATIAVVGVTLGLVGGVE